MNKAYTIKELQALPDDDLNAMAAELRGFYNHLLAFSLYDTNADGRSVMICTKSDWQPATDRNQSGELLAWAVENGADFMIRNRRLLCGDAGEGREADIMHYGEKLIDGVLCCRNLPDGEWQYVSVEQLSQRLVALESQRRNFASAIADRIAALEYERNNAKKQAERLAVNGQIGLVRAIWHDFEYEDQESPS